MSIAFKREIFNSEPLRFKLSNAIILFDGFACLNAIAKLDPTKPHPPVIKIVFCIVKLTFTNLKINMANIPN